jgi:uncharacterized protein YifE (UPF0438 family)
MTTPVDHQDWLRRGEYPVPAGGDLTDSERQLLVRFGHWMNALTNGTLAPVTPDQERFLRVYRGEEPPTTPFEVAWHKLHRILTTAAELAKPVSPFELSNLFARLEAVRAEALAAQQRYTFRRLDVLAKVQPELDAIDYELGPELKTLADQMAKAEAAVRAAVLAYGQSFSHGCVKATYSRGRVTYDSQLLQQYAETHPEVNRFKKVSRPIVSLRYITAGEEPVPASPPQALSSREEAPSDS